MLLLLLLLCVVGLFVAVVVVVCLLLVAYIYLLTSLFSLLMFILVALSADSCEIFVSFDATSVFFVACCGICLFLFVVSRLFALISTCVPFSTKLLTCSIALTVPSLLGYRNNNDCASTPWKMYLTSSL